MKEVIIERALSQLDKKDTQIVETRNYIKQAKMLSIANKAI